jgi:hypothetical protein
MEGNEVHAAGNGRVYYGFVGGGKPLTGRRVHAPYLGNEVRSEPWQRGDGVEQCSLRRTRKEGTDVGWRLRADLHHDGDPGCARPGCGLMSRSPGTSAESLLAATVAGWERRGVSCERFGVSSRRSCGPVDHFGRCDPVRVLVAGGQGQPCARWMLAWPRLWSGPWSRRISTACADKKARAGGDGRRKCLPVMPRTGFVAPRYTHCG